MKAINNLNQPPYQFCDGGTEEEEQPLLDAGEVKATEKKPEATEPRKYKLNVVDYDENGQKVHVTEELTIGEILKRAQMSTSMIENKNKSLNAIIKKEVTAALASLPARGISADDVTKIVQQVGAGAGTPGQESAKQKIINEMMDKMDPSSQAVFKMVLGEVDTLKTIIADDQTERKDKETAYRSYNENIKKILVEYPELDGDALVEGVEKLGLDPSKVEAYGEILAGFKKHKINIEDLPEEQRKEIETQIQAKLDATPPPGIEGTVSKGEEKEEEVPTSPEDMMDKALQILDKMKKEGVV